MTISAPVLYNKKTAVDLRGHHALCELNYHRIQQILFDLRSGREKWSFCVTLNGSGVNSNIEVEFNIIDAAPYTTTIEILQNHPDIASIDFMQQPKMVIRLYHDASMAEIVSWNKHRCWLPKYHYPNRHMYHPDEKLALNQFFGDWLVFCLKHGYLRSDICDQVLVNRK